MIIRNNKTTSVLYKGTKEIIKKYKGTLLVYEAWKNLVASGVPPLTLLNCSGKDLVDYKIYGYSKQSGTPTLEAPIEVESVGEKTKNLCNAIAENMLDYRSDYANYTIENGKLITTGNTLTGVIIPVKPNTTYSFGYKILRTTANYVALRIREYEKIDEGYSGGNPTQPISEQYQKDGQCSGTITTLETTKYVLLALYTTGSAEIYDFMANEGDTLLDYEPYYEGYKIPVKASGKNLFDDSYFKIAKNYKIIWSGGYASAKVVLKPNTKYTIQPYRITGIAKPTTNMFYKVGNSTTEPASCTNIGSYVASSGNYSFGKATVITNEDGIIYFHASSNATQEIIDKIFTYFYFQLVEGTTVPDYEPYHEPITTNIYLNEPLRKTMDYDGDYIDFKNKKVVRNVMCYSLKNRTWVEQAGTYKFYFVRSLPISVSATTRNQYSNCFVVKTIGATVNSGIGIQVMTNGIVRVRPDLTIYDTKEKWKAYADTHDIYVIYTLKTPIEEEIELPNIPTIKGTTILEVDTTIQPSNLEVVYKGKGNNQILSVETNSVLNSILGADTETEIDITNTEINEILDKIIGG